MKTNPTINNPIIGTCLCGAVTITISADATDLGVCHCPACQQWSGGPFLELEVGQNIAFEGEEFIQRYSSSQWAQRGFCGRCGSHLFMQDLKSGDYGVPPGLFKALRRHATLQVSREIFADKKPVYYQFAGAARAINSDFIYQHFPHVKPLD